MTDLTQHLKNLHANDHTTRLAAIKALGEAGDANVVDDLLPLLHDDSPEIRRESVLALRRINDERAFPAMVETLNDLDTSVRRRTSAWIMSMGQDSRLVASLSALLRDDNARIPAREFSAMALGNIADRDAVEPLAEVLLKSPPELKRRITHSLSLMPDARAVAALAHLLDDDDLPTRKIAAKTLRKIGTAEALKALEAISNE